MTDVDGPTISNLLHEGRRFQPSAEFAAHANVTADVYDEAAADRLAFWAKQARRLEWATPFEQVLDWSRPPFAKWFADGTLNVAVNCLDRHVAAGLGDRVAYYFEGDRGDTRVITYRELTDLVCQAANALTGLGVKAGDRVAIYMPMIPETVVAMLACARLWGPSHGRLRRVLIRGVAQQDRRLQRAGGDHRGRRVQKRCRRAAQTRRRPGDRRRRPGGHRAGREANRCGRHLGGGP